MKLSNLIRRFRAKVARAGVPLAELTPRDGLRLLLRFMEDDPASEDLFLSACWEDVSRYGPSMEGFVFSVVERNPDLIGGDFSLLFQVGAKNEIEEFPDPYGINHLERCFHYGDLGVESQVAHDENEVESPPVLFTADVDPVAFLARCEDWPAFRALGDTRAAGVVIEETTDSRWAYYDCWGYRDHRRPIVHMTEDEWLRSDDVGLMLRWYRQDWKGSQDNLNRLIRRYLLACCRRIELLLPYWESLMTLEVGAWELEGNADDINLGNAQYIAEGAAFHIDFGKETEEVARWCEKVSRLSPQELGAMIASPRPGDDLSPYGLLQKAAYFVEQSLFYPGCPPEGVERYRIFMPVPLLREVVGNPFSVNGPTRERHVTARHMTAEDWQELERLARRKAERWMSG
ncbi:hypothetical protein [Paludisphaera rhizosphaerae]|uniref:hypothetical protein n=1 Tax=Paludisphaera rhizosphaerae TaxID=2711216 RepID=UPI0013EBF5C5|nr:hypothetical protein [Paludisphaera rhizosphaerae]